MARRFSAPYLSEPVSRLASWSRNLAVFSVVAVLVSIVIVRFGFLEIKPALATFFGALACAGVSILVGIAGAAMIWQSGERGMGRILLAFLIDAMLLAYPAYLGLQYRKLPARPWRGCAAAMAPIRRPMPGFIRPSSSASLTPTSRPSSSNFRCSGPMRSRCN